MGLLAKKPTFEIEHHYWHEGIMALAGIDEVGMGALAGPVVAGAVIFTEEVDISLLRDSKLLSPKQRAEVVQEIYSKAAAWAIGEASVGEITTLNIRKASHLAMRRAAEKLAITPDLLLIDGLPAHIHPSIPSTNLVKGDRICCSIAAASIIAKVHRDHIMEELHQSFPMYGFDGHKGYGSAQHMEALQMHGVSPHHRASYAPVAALLKR